MRRWFRFYLRQKTSALSVSYSQKMKQKLATFYAFIAWNAAGIYLYYTIKEDNPETEEDKKKPGNYYARLMQTPDIKVIRLDGLKLIDNFELSTEPSLNNNNEEIKEENPEFSNKELI